MSAVRLVKRITGATSCAAATPALRGVALADQASCEPRRILTPGATANPEGSRGRGGATAAYAHRTGRDVNCRVDQLSADLWANMNTSITSRGFSSALFLLLAAAGRAQAQQCDLAMLQSHLAAVQQECCFDDSISDLQENLVAVRICDTELVLLPASYVACCQSRAATDRLQRHP